MQTSHESDSPSAIFGLVSARDIEGAIKLCEKFASSVNLTPREFLSKQCSERSYLIYRLSTESRKEALEIAHSGESFPDGLKAVNLLTEASIWPAEVKEQYQRSSNCLHLSRVALSLGSVAPARDYQIIGKSVVWKLLFGRTACVLQTFMSRQLQASRTPHEFALANHKKAARLFDERLGGPGPVGPLEKPDDSTSHSVDEFRRWSLDREAASSEHMRLISHLVSDVSKHVLGGSEAKSFLHAADVIFSNEIDDEKERAYIRGVLRTTLRQL